MCGFGKSRIHCHAGKVDNLVIGWQVGKRGGLAVRQGSGECQLCEWQRSCGISEDPARVHPCM